MEIIALSGYARSGKDAAAKVLVEEFGFKRVAFADKLREMLYQLNPIVLGWSKNPITNEMGHYNTEAWHLQEVIDRYGWDGYKETPWGYEIRRLLQRLGTEAGRQTLWDSIWIDAALTGLDDDAKVCISDMRFENEMSAIVNRGGKTLRIWRSGVGPANMHPSEISLDSATFDAEIMNDGTLEEFQEKVRRFANEYIS